MVKDDLKKFSLHYFLDDNSHSMDARVRNQCEAHFLTLAYEAIGILGLDIKIEAEAMSEGGIKEWWAIFGANAAQVTALCAIIALILSEIPDEDQELMELQKQDIKLSIQQRKLALSTVKREINNKILSQNSIDNAAHLINHSNKAVVAKSNFYKKLSGYKKVTQIGIAAANDKNEIVLPEKIITRKKFPKFILKPQKLKPDIDNEAMIIVAAPVILEGTKTWKGVYQEKPLSFKMNDVDFQDAVLAKKYRFASGDAIRCELHTHKKLDQAGEIVTTGYSVEVVLDYIEGDDTKETPQGHAKRYTNNQRENQHELLLAENEIDL